MHQEVGGSLHSDGRSPQSHGPGGGAEELQVAVLGSAGVTHYDVPPNQCLAGGPE